MNFRWAHSRVASLAACAAVYLAAGAAGFFAARALGWPDPVLAAAAADAVATLVVFAASVALDNSSVYDPYWSVAPVFIALFWALGPGGAPLSPRGVAALALVAAWAVRLTYNWVRRWRGLAHEDWRYADYRRFGPAAYWAVSFFGFHFMPTALVFLGCLSLRPVLGGPALPLRSLDLAALVVTAGAIITETHADRELRRFLRSGPARGDILQSGMWALSRHPNYFGEVLFWWGLFLFGLAANPSWWWTIAGPAAITLLFLFISVPMMERHMAARHPGYEERQEGKSPFVPWFSRPDEEEG